MGLTIPKSIRLEHAGLHKELTGIILGGGEVGRAAKKVAEALHKHFGKEEKYAMPPLGALIKVSAGKKIKDNKKLISLTARLERLMPEMLGEHKLIVKRLNMLEKAAKKNKNREALNFVKNLKLHALNEEEVLYPASILIGKYLKVI